MRTTLVLACTIMCSAALAGCSAPPPTTTPDAPRAQSHTPSHSEAALSVADFCLDGLTLASTGEQVRTSMRPKLRQGGGFDYESPAMAAYLSSDGQSVVSLKGPVARMCNPHKALQASGHLDLTTHQVITGYGEPTRKMSEGNREYWVYEDKPRDQAFIFLFVQGKSDTVYLTRMARGARQWYPLLGDVQRPLPLERKDAAVGPLRIGMAPDAAADLIDSDYDEGALPPYSKYVYKRKGLEFQADNQVRAVFLWEGSGLHTPRGIHVGSTTSDLLSAYGEARVLTSVTGDQIWSYENFREGIGLVFWVKNGMVTMLDVLDHRYQFRPEIK